MPPTRRHRALRAFRRLLAKPKITMRGAFHKGLRSHEFEVRIEAGDHRMIAIAVDKVTDIRESHVLVGFTRCANNLVASDALKVSSPTCPRLGRFRYRAYPPSRIGI